jgi:hypothetical protein
MLPIIILILSVLFAVAFGRLTESSQEKSGEATDSSGRVMAAPGRGLRRTRTAAPPSTTRIAMQVIISLVLLAGALYTILFGHYDADHEKWAYGAIGTVAGYWLKG